jgi:two-component system, OmpR family, phosphate regulon sensor histidine kinase PhoR
MKKKNILRYIIVVSAVSLTGLVIFQAFWAIKAFRLVEKHYDHRVYSAMFGAITEARKTFDAVAVDTAKDEARAFFEQIKPNILDSLIVVHGNYNDLHSDFEFAIVRNYGDSIIYTSTLFNELKSKNIVYKKCFSGFNKGHEFHLELFYKEKRKGIFLEMTGWLFLIIFFLILVILCFTYISFTVIKQKKLSEMKNDFINNMTHELKTPISTITLASEVLLNSSKSTSTEKLRRYAKIIYDENQRLRLQVDQVLRMAQFEKKNESINKECIDIHELLQTTINNLCLEQIDKNVNVTYRLEAINHYANVDPVHFTNIITNLVDNAIKYSNEPTEIMIISRNIDHGIIVSFCDNGIGIHDNEQKLIFDNFYRVPTGDVHNVKGFGIGLYYVKKIIEAHGGWIKIESEPGKGSRFNLFIPKSMDNNE